MAEKLIYPYRKTIGKYPAIIIPFADVEYHHLIEAYLYYPREYKDKVLKANPKENCPYCTWYQPIPSPRTIDTEYQSGYSIGVDNYHTQDLPPIEEQLEAVARWLDEVIGE